MLRYLLFSLLLTIFSHVGNGQNCTLNLGKDTTICFPDSLVLDAGSGFLTYNWSTGDTTQTYIVTQPGTYLVNVQNIGPSVVNNGSFTNGNTGFTSGYTYATWLWPEGTYWVGPNAVTVHPNFVGTAFSAPNFMVVNGSSNSTLNVWCQTINAITPNTTYQFSARVSSVVASNPAILQFRVNGIPLSAAFTAPATTNSWVQYSATWFSGNNTTASICIQNQSIAVSGNDFGLDNIVFRPVCNLTDTIVVSGTTMANVVFSMPDSLCPTPLFMASASPAAGYWGGSNVIDTVAGTFDFSEPGIYEYFYTIPGKCGDVDSGFVYVASIPAPQLGADFELCPGNTATLGPVGLADKTLWNTAETSTSITISDTGTFWVQQTNLPGCAKSDTIHILYRCPMPPQLIMPNVFSPNGDGINDFVNIAHAYIGTFQMQIVNRWGQLVFESNDINDTWDGHTTTGEMAAAGVYFYILTYEGAEVKGEHTLQGTLTLFN